MPSFRPDVPPRVLAATILVLLALLGISFAARAEAIGPGKEPFASLSPQPLRTVEPTARPRRAGSAANAAAPATGAATVAMTVQLADLNSSKTVERSQCVTVATGVRSAYECGDLRMVHALPAFRTRNQARAPVLLYNAQHAHPRPTVYADVTLPAGAAVPTLVYADVVIGGVVVASASYPGGDWQPGAARRVALQWDGLNTATGLYAYTLQVVAAYGTTQAPSIPARDTMAVVNRKSSPFGAGWWLAGWEELVPSGPNFLWVGGDGSTRFFIPDTIANQWKAWNPSGARDELRRFTDPGNGEIRYRRVLRGGGSVYFTSGGTHYRTDNRLEHTTWFTLDGARLGSISLPVAGGAAPTYTFGYDAEGRLAQVQAAAPGADTRTTLVERFGAGDRRVASIQDPDQKSVAFEYDPQVTRRISAYTDRRMTYTSFTFDAAGKISGTRLRMGAAQTPFDIVRGFQAGESKGVASSVATSDVYTRLDGARTDVVDHTYLWITRFGAPSRIRDALGHETQIFRENGVFPALVTRTVAPNGFTQRVEFTGRGMPRRVISINARDDGKADTLTYTYNNARWPDFATTIIPPERDSVTIAYRNDGSRAWQTDALGRTVYFRYYDSGPHKGLLRATDMPETPPDSVTYDATLGNLSGTRSPLGVWTQYVNDGIGQSSDVATPVDSAGQLLQHQYTYYDAMGRDTLVRATGPALPYSLPWAPAGAPPVLAEQTEVRKVFDGEGNVLTVLSTTNAPDGADVQSNYTYDQAGRKRTEFVGQKLTTWTYDPAGNVDTTYSDRGLRTVMRYDAANRMISRVMPAAVYAAETCAAHGPLFPCTYRFPLYPNHASGGLTVPGDTATFTYDAAGNLLTANNRAARIRRTYTPGGLLATDSLRIRVYGGAQICPTIGCMPETQSIGVGGAEGFDTGIASVTDPYPASEFTTHVYGLGYRYDRNSRLRDLLGPAAISAAFGRDSTRYTYNLAGELIGVRDPLNNVFGFEYDNDGRPVRTIYPDTANPVVETRTYDADGRLTRRRAAGACLVHDDSIEYDVRGKALRVREAWGSNIIQNRYSGLGTLVASSHGQTTAIPTVEEYRADPMGHMYWSRTRNPETGNAPEMGYEYAPNSSAVVGTVSINTQSQTQMWHPDTTYTSLDEAGNVIVSGQRSYRTVNTGYGLMINLVSSSATRHYYGADEKLRFLQKYHWTGEATKGTFDEYRYDARGRRVLQRMRRDSLCTGSECTSAIERYVWSGDQLLYEIRAQGGDNATAAQLESDIQGGDEFGRVGYTHAAGIDAPLSVIRTGHVSGNVTLIPHSDYRGAYHAASTSNGGIYNCGPNDPCLYVLWPKPYWGSYFKGGDPAAGDWAGSLIRGQQDISGLMYRRNRYYDPMTGQFTQSDPIGIAGGLNTYGFAEGDPVSYSDPYGLKVEFENDRAERLWRELEREVIRGLNSRDMEVRLNARYLQSVMQDIEASPNTLSLNVGRQNVTVDRYGGAKTFAPIWGLFNDNARTIIDANFGRQRFDLDLTISLAHELGHAWAIMTDNVDRVGPAIQTENAARILHRCSPSRYSDRQLPPRCR
ncbi:RHS repeat-associated core domain-containing protein [Longimicrobium sp.]|uniref:RHS repeat-associated core domain-containing protein n=1 Tax=Longimicrobium sp. TaxID=2029185 RepID=UPI003B3AF561